jgi:glutathione peroxidase
MMAKISVAGDDKAPVYKWLTEKIQNGKEDAEVTWNFQKFMIDENGNWAGMVPPKTNPKAEEIISWIEK